MRQLLMIATCLLMAANVWAFGPSSDTGNDTRVSGEEGVTTEGSIDKKTSKSDRTSKTKSDSRDISAGETLRNTASAMKSGSLDLTVSADVGFLRVLKQMEQEGVQPFATCKVISRPKLAADFGLSAERGRMVLTTLAERLKSAAEGNADVSTVTDEAPIREYRDCLAIYGAVVKAAFENLSADMASLDFVKKKTVKGALAEVRGIGFKDYLFLSEGAMRRAVANLDQIGDRYQDILEDPTPCRFEGNLNTIQCSSAQIALSSKPTLTAAGIALFGNGTYGGFGASYKISSGWSYADAWEAMKSDSTAQRFAKEYAKAVEVNKSKGNSVRALVAEKSAYDRSRGAKTSLSADKFLPQGGQ